MPGLLENGCKRHGLRSWLGSQSTWPPSILQMGVASDSPHQEPCNSSRIHMAPSSQQGALDWAHIWHNSLRPGATSIVSDWFELATSLVVVGS
eukprot:CAMPEP_0180570566 /NCGR_PEP_ID=MMETSP1037_2-20121125/8267_1 /TAXON_ID=632150 /ORGANISM="Azadinium spinosum, Strain 3D9" /LENGTH=92 /DNA_ID=CAMNT_0022587851 /DNA_START=151 /DNA_END=430 /DNA_ORIENTATION=+